MSHPLLDPRRLAALHALGLRQVWVPRDALAEAEAPPPAHSDGEPEPAAEGVTAAVAPAVRRGEPLEAAPAALARQPASQRAARIGALSWDALRAACGECRACQLGGMRQQAVFGVGHPQARVMVVGEAPGAEEDRLGEPFVGAAGKLLDNMLRACGWQRHGDDARSTVYIANVIKCRPPGNRNPEPDEIAECLPILQRQIELVRPRLLLALGRFAAQALTGSSEPIGRLRQRVWDWRGTPLVVSYHPAYLLRTPQDKAKAWADLCRALDVLDELPREPADRVAS